MAEQLTQLNAIRPEDALMLQCARIQLYPDGIAHIQRLLAQPLNWSYILQRADEHHVNLLLYANLQTVQNQTVPPEAMLSLANFYKGNKRHNLFLALELLRLQEAFQSHDIPFLPFKGCTLAMMAYGDLALRRFGDLDLCLREQDIPRASSLLTEQGYVQVDSKDGKFTEAAVQPAEWNYHYTFQHLVSQHEVELHWQLAPPYYYFPLSFDHIMKRARLINLAGRKVHTCSAEDLLQILCMHAAKHSWLYLGWASDIAELLRASPMLDWDYVTSQMQTLHSRRSVLLGLCLANQLLDAQLPAPIIQAIQATRPVQGMAEQVYSWLFGSNSPNLEFERSIFQVRVRDNWLDRLLYIRLKQPMLDTEIIESIPAPALIPRSNWPYYELLRVMRFLWTKLLKPLKRLWPRSADVNTLKSKPKPKNI